MHNCLEISFIRAFQMSPSHKKNKDSLTKMLPSHKIICHKLM